jgi:hypothetical protein
MGAERFSWRWWARGAAAGALVAAALAGGGPVAAGSYPDGTAAPRTRPAAGVISTVAGGVGGPARATRVAIPAVTGAPCGVSFGAGRVYVANYTTVREVTPGTDGLTTPAGTGAPGPAGNGGPGSKASVDPCTTAVDQAGNLLIADFGNQEIRVVAARTGTFYGTHMQARHIYAVAGDGNHGFGGDGGPATQAELFVPYGVGVDAAGNVLIADTANERIRGVAAHTGTYYGQAMTAGDIYTAAGDGTPGFSGDGGPAAGAELSGPWAVAAGAAGDLVIADTSNSRIRQIAG